MKLPLWSVGVAVSILAWVVDLIASKGQLDVQYVSVFILAVWGGIFTVYGFEKIIFKEEFQW